MVTKKSAVNIDIVSNHAREQVIARYAELAAPNPPIYQETVDYMGWDPRQEIGPSQKALWEEWEAEKKQKKLEEEMRELTE